MNRKNHRTALRSHVCRLLPALLGLAALASAASPSFKAGETFSYKLLTAGSSGAAEIQGSDKPMYARGIPTTETVAIKGIEPCGAGKCYAVQIDSVVPPFLPQEKDKDYQEKIRARVDVATGDVRALTSDLTIGQSVSTNEQSVFTRLSMVGDFYGPWMLDLKPGYKQSIPGKAITVSVEMTGRERFGGHDCLVARRTVAPTGGGSVTTTYWVDAKRHVAVKIQGSNGRALALGH